MRASPKANLLAALHHHNPDHVPHPGENAFRVVDHLGRKPPRTGQDIWGVTWAPLPESYRVGAGEPAESFPVAHPFESAEALLAHPFPGPAASDWFTGLLADVDPQAMLVIGQHPAGPLDRFITLLGMTGAMTALLREPEASRLALDRIAEHHVSIARGYLAAGAQAGWLADDYASNGGPLLRPALWRQMILPGLRRVINVYREAGAPVFFHTCGRAEAFVADLLDAGVTAFNLESSVCDLPALKARYGAQIAFYGGVPTGIMLTGSPADVQAAVQAAIVTLSQGGGLIVAPDQNLAFPPENVAALIAAARRCGSPGGTNG